jgi:hypothetical protein
VDERTADLEKGFCAWEKVCPHLLAQARALDDKSLGGEMSQDSIPKCLDDAEYLLTYELGTHSWRTLLFDDADELRGFLEQRSMYEKPHRFFIRKLCVMDNDAFISGDNHALENYVRISHA